MKRIISVFFATITLALSGLGLATVPVATAAQTIPGGGGYGCATRGKWDSLYIQGWGDRTLREVNDHLGATPYMWTVGDTYKEAHYVLCWTRKQHGFLGFTKSTPHRLKVWATVKD